MEELVLDLQNKVKLFQTLENYSLEFGIFAEDANKKVIVNIINPDQTISKIDMELSNVMYFTELGTLTIPAKPILETTMIWVSTQLDELIDKIYDGIFFYNWNESYIETELNAFVLKVNNFIKSQLLSTIESNNYLTKIINETTSQPVIYDLNKLLNFIKVKLIKK